MKQIFTLVENGASVSPQLFGECSEILRKVISDV